MARLKRRVLTDNLNSLSKVTQKKMRGPHKACSILGIALPILAGVFLEVLRSKAENQALRMHRYLHKCKISAIDRRGVVRSGRAQTFCTTDIWNLRREAFGPQESRDTTGDDGYKNCNCRSNERCLRQKTGGNDTVHDHLLVSSCLENVDGKWNI